MMSADRPAISAARPPRLVPARRSPKQTPAVAPHRKRRRASSVLSRLSRIDVLACGSMFIEADEVTQRHGIGAPARFRERIDAQCFLETDDEDGDAERVEPRIEQN